EGADPQPKDVLLFLCERMLQTDPEGTPVGRKEKNDSIFTVLYHSCPSCKAARVMTADGPVEVPREHLERVEGEAKEVSSVPGEEAPATSPGLAIDRPNTPALIRKVALRDGERCAVPFCGRRRFHGHHIRARSEGGPTAVWNEVLLCTVHHALVHRGL